MELNELIIRLATAIESQNKFPNWELIIGAISTSLYFITIMFLLIERHEKNRPYLQISFELVRSSLACIVLRNTGECPLKLKSMKFSDDFIKQLPEEKQKRFLDEQYSSVSIFPNRTFVISFDVIVGDVIDKFETQVVTIDYQYMKLNSSIFGKKTYSEHTTIDFSEYKMFLIYISEVDEFKRSVDALSVEMKKIEKAIIDVTQIGEGWKKYIISKTQ